MTEELKEALYLLDRLYKVLVEMPTLSTDAKNLLGETDDFLKKYDDLEEV